MGAYIVADEVLGPGAFVVSLLLSGILISPSVPLVMAGPRALQRLGEDYVILSWLGGTNAHGLPRNAIVLMGVIALLFCGHQRSGRYCFAGLVMATNTLFTVMAVFVSRARHKREAQQSVFTIPFYPLPAIIFLSITEPMLSRQFSTLCGLP